MTKIIPISAYPLEVQHAKPARYQFIPIEDLPKHAPHISQDPDFAHAYVADQDALDEQYRRDGLENSKLVLTWLLLGSVMFWAGVIWFVARHMGKH